MSRFLKKAAVASAVALAFSGSVFAAPTPISNGVVSAIVNDSGTFSSLSYTGTEFIAHGTPMSYYWLNAGGSSFVADNASSTNPLFALTSGAGSVAFSASAGGLVFNQTISLIGSKAVVSVVLSNETTAAIGSVTWGVGFDPDQGIPVAPSTFSTFNSIVGQGSAAAAKAVDLDDPYKIVTLRNTTDAGAFAIEAQIGPGCCGPVDPVSILGGGIQGVGSYGLSDSSLNLAYDIGSIAAGTSVTIGYEYVFAVPEPETYAMLLAGLGLMGFVARRRQRKLAA
jgi:hypothetical protein